MAFRFGQPFRGLRAGQVLRPELGENDKFGTREFPIRFFKGNPNFPWPGAGLEFGVSCFGSGRGGMQDGRSYDQCIASSWHIGCPQTRLLRRDIHDMAKVIDWLCKSCYLQNHRWKRPQINRHPEVSGAASVLDDWFCVKEHFEVGGRRVCEMLRGSL